MCALPAVAEGPETLRFSITDAKIEYRLGDALQFTACITNVSREDVFAYGDLAYWLWLWPQDATGQDMPTAFIVEHLPPPPSRDSFVPLNPRHALCLQDWFRLDDLGITSPGTYSVKIIFANPVPPTFAKTWLGIDVWDGMPSRPTIIEFTVRP